MSDPLDNLLDIARNTYPINSLVDLSTIKIAASLLPNYAICDRGTCDLLDALHAIIFHVVLPIRTQAAEDWFDKNYIPITAKEESINYPIQSDLLDRLGLTQKIDRRF